MAKYDSNTNHILPLVYTCYQQVAISVDKIAAFSIHMVARIE